MTQPNPLVPSQEAREAAADAWRAHSSEQKALEIAAGEHDDWPIVQSIERAFQAIRKDEAEQCARVADSRILMSDYPYDQESCERIAAALRARHAGGGE